MTSIFRLRRATLLLFTVSFFFASTQVFSQANDEFVYWPEANYDPTIPTVEKVLGYKPGERITWHRDVLRYFDALAAAAPDRMVVKEYARTWEGRELVYAVISSVENITKLKDIKSAMQQLADPRITDEDTAAQIIASQPAVTWLSYGVHGNEISSTEAAMLTAYHLLASRGDDRVADILANTVIAIDPMQNPDGRDRFIHNFEVAEGLQPSSDRISAEHDEPWPGGRTNHYLFDMNRDWFMQTQPETRGRSKAMLEWFPVAYVDAHEMGSDGTYFFAPEAEPFNPHLAADQRASLQLFGRNNAKWFDQFGFDYFTREVYDAFYPGYGASWPSYFGSIAMTYEQASARGLLVRQYDGVDLHYRNTIRNHFVTSLATAETVSNNRQKLLEDFYDYRASAIAEGKREDIRVYLIPTQADQAAANKLAGLLVSQGVDVQRADSSFRACSESYQAGSFLIRTDQPAKRFIRTLLDRNVAMEDDFLAEQERRRAKNLPDEIYDVTAWSLPLMMNIEAETCNRIPSGDFSAVGSDLFVPGTVTGGVAEVAYLVPWGSATAVRFLSGAMKAELAVKSSDKTFTSAGVQYPAGTLILDVADNPDSLAITVQKLATLTGANVIAVNDSWVTDGPSFGSANVARYNQPRIAMAWDIPTNSLSAGNTRFVIERQFDYPVTSIRTHRLRTADLSDYQVLILPATSGQGYKPLLGKAGIENLKMWVNRGGVLIALGNATRFLADPEVDLVAIRREKAVLPEEIEKEKEKKKKKSDIKEARVEGKYITAVEEYESSIKPNEDSPDSVAGVLVRADVDPDHWLAAGVASTLNVLVRGSDVYTPIRLNDGVNVARFAGPDELLASGYLWEENRKQLAYKPFVVSQPKGRGQVIAFTQEPTVRAYLDGLNLIFMNSIFRASAHARPAR